MQSRYTSWEYYDKLFAVSMLYKVIPEWQKIYLNGLNRSNAMKVRMWWIYLPTWSTDFPWPNTGKLTQ